MRWNMKSLKEAFKRHLLTRQVVKQILSLQKDDIENIFEKFVEKVQKTIITASKRSTSCLNCGKISRFTRDCNLTLGRSKCRNCGEICHFRRDFTDRFLHYSTICKLAVRICGTSIGFAAPEVVLSNAREKRSILF